MTVEAQFLTVTRRLKGEGGRRIAHSAKGRAHGAKVVSPPQRRLVNNIAKAPAVAEAMARQAKEQKHSSLREKREV